MDEAYFKMRDELFKEHGEWYYEAAWRMSPHWKRVQ